MNLSKMEWSRPLEHQSSGATIDCIESAISKVEKHEKTVIDIGVLRFPDCTQPYFKLYHIKLMAWSQSSRTMACQDDSNGIEGTFNSQKYKPRKAVINRISPKI